MPPRARRIASSRHRRRQSPCAAATSVPSSPPRTSSHAACSRSSVTGTPSGDPVADYGGAPRQAQRDDCARCAGSARNGHCPRMAQGNRSVNPVWTWERANRTVALSTARPVDVPVQRGRPDRIDSLFDGACPTAATPGIPAGPNAYGSSGLAECDLVQIRIGNGKGTDIPFSLQTIDTKWVIRNGKSSGRNPPFRAEGPSS